ncbi:MAG: [NiFe]-hydrogenase assembly chaperone HybE [Gammaproteobacteria bacterium]|nr:[NiFe]-hydrogenase assembly chaperone HybE [Gammaproteobacteria bacterium]
MSLDPQAAAELFVEVFDRVHREQMAGLPLLNDRLQVETLGFRVFEGRMIGILITPWLMNVVMMPGENDDWSSDELGHKIPQRFPAGTYKFMVNEIEGIGRYLTHSLYSPMREFSSQNHALAAAESWLRTAMDPAQADQRDPIDEELLGRVMRGEETPDIDVDELESIAFGQGDAVEAPRVRGLQGIGVRVEEKGISRRDLLRGRLRSDSANETG